ncbi:MAG: asparagine synthase-related protein [Steroidobacteraceae bacterium]
MTDRFRQIHPAWKLLDWGKGLSIFHSPPTGRSAGEILLPAGTGAILGTLFPEDLDVSPRHWRPTIDEKLADEIVRTRGRRLMKCFWGSYIAFLNNRDGTEHYILRDCSGKIPCYKITRGDTTILTSNINDLSGLPFPSFSLNARYLAGFVYAAELAQKECALNEVTELLAGECLELADTHARQLTLWDPRTICRECAVENFEEASRQVRRVTQACVDSWASKYDRIVHLLSGGLDSSVILGCLKRSPHSPLVTCLHLESGEADEDEREFAQLAASAADVELIFQPGYSQHAKYDEQIFRLPRAPKPSVAHLGITIESDLRNLVPSQAKAEAIWDGQGGDHLFFESRAAFGAVDYAFRHGLTGDFSGHVRSAIRRSGLSYWGVLGRSLRLGLLRAEWRPEDEYHREVTFLNPAIVPANIADYVWQPWLADASDLPPGKRWQICLLGRLIHRHRPVPELQYASEHHPLFSQPLFELCLRIPTYTLAHGGIDRAVERAAFADRVPEQIIRRENKGSVSTSLMSKIRECRPFLRDLVLDGVLVKERIIERASLEPFLAGNRPVNHEVFWPFLSCIAAEVWARKWADVAWRL